LTDSAPANNCFVGKKKHSSEEYRAEQYFTGISSWKRHISSYNYAKLYMRVLNLFPFLRRVLFFIEKSTVLDLRTLRRVDLFMMFSAKKISLHQ
jgi:hypothetical protein